MTMMLAARPPQPAPLSPLQTAQVRLHNAQFDDYGHVIGSVCLPCILEGIGAVLDMHEPAGLGMFHPPAGGTLGLHRAGECMGL